MLNIRDTVARDKIVSRFRELELPTYEALIYVSLLAHSYMTASALCKETGIPDSKIYYALDGLSKKGMLVVQKGNPNLYVATPPGEAVANLKNQLTESYNEKMREADALVDVLNPIYESAEKSGELEIAYLIKGQKNIINRMKALIESARKEITVFIAYPAVFNALKETLENARVIDRLTLNIAVSEEVFEKESTSELGDVRLLCCPVGMLISDTKTMLTLSDWAEETAMLTQDPNLIRMARDSYDNPRITRACSCEKGTPKKL